MSPAKKSVRATRRARNVVPDTSDIRDRIYQPPVSQRPAPSRRPRFRLPVLDQGETNACTGFALASVVHMLLSAGKAKFDPKFQVSPYMLYSMARRYDEFPGDPKADTGSSLRGAMKGWFKQGVCHYDLWKTEKMPSVLKGKYEPSRDWWLDAVKHPLGAYYRIDIGSLSDMIVALNEVDILYASVVCHSGWDEGVETGRKMSRGCWTIPYREAGLNDGGHAFVIVGYDEEGFLIQNSWGPDWGTRGLARLTYRDWLTNAMDCWVAQLGVVTEQHEDITKASSLRVKDEKVQLATIPTLRNREIDPFIINMENNGRLSNTGDFRTQPEDITWLVNHHLGTALETWTGGSGDSMLDVAIYAHGGLTTESDAANTASKWIKTLYDNRIFPIFLMWETGFWDTIKGGLHDLVAGQPRMTGGFLRDIWNKRVERLLSVPGSFLWQEMKQNAEAITSNTVGQIDGRTEYIAGGIQLYDAFKSSKYFRDKSRIRLHLIGHSAGSIVHSHLVSRLVDAGWRFETVNFMAPAVTCDAFVRLVGPALKKGDVKRYHQFHLTEKCEETNPTCTPILGYGHSLLYLVSESFEHGCRTPILGMKRSFEETVKKHNLPNVQAFCSPGTSSMSTTHGGFDDDDATLASVIGLIKGRPVKP